MRRNTVKILFDTNVILDVFLDRQPFSEDAAALLSCAERGDIAGYAAAGALVRVEAIATRNKQDFRLASVSAHTPAELLELLAVRPNGRHVGAGAHAE